MYAINQVEGYPVYDLISAISIEQAEHLQNVSSPSAPATTRSPNLSNNPTHFRIGNPIKEPTNQFTHPDHFPRLKNRQGKNKIKIERIKNLNRTA